MKFGYDIHTDNDTHATQHKEILEKAIKENDKLHNEKFPKMLQQWLKSAKDSSLIGINEFNKLTDFAKQCNPEDLCPQKRN
jgi:hypothetical protein